ncbi:MULTISPECIES: glycoside hydrolase domain-containing protein [unclassified Rathayibacter]|uniref:glycoside hydrolase domain-containing protein n=1 Tax=unclassified Rathayibacter TaxID=2609250 RepID=UPI00188D394D|nr:MULTISPECIES: glycoside hydrolase domain-containing protein [unclassified Rathayibacter]MBF4461079.1 DUF1906 domain-containing protein [Rathayibacter sp. VKM Ac-2879]MBF4502490.1 DUF1906 domain-containing protein [Rathayibacter sp. VKM Ac-2878]
MGDPWIEATQQWYKDTYESKPGFASLAVDGRTGWDTIYALTRALQHELGLSNLSDNFGDSTLAALTAFGTISASKPTPGTPSNIVKIAQGALYCKGYNSDNGSLSGLWGTTTRSAMSALRNDLGLGSTSSDLPPKLFKFLLTMEATTLLSNGNTVVRDGQRAMNGRYQLRRDFFFVGADGVFLRDTHKAVLFAIQYELDMVDGVANGNFGPGTRSGLQTKANLTVGSVDSTKIFVRLFHLMLKVNGYNSTWSGTYSSATATMVNSFQAFVGLSVTGTANLQTWSALLVSTGDPDRPGTGSDCVTALDAGKLSTLRAAGYQYFGRYLTNTPDREPDKALRYGEPAAIIAAGGKLFPIFQTGGAVPSHFTSIRGAQVAEEAAAAAIAYRIPANTIIYFTVDYDAYDWEVTDNIIPYFQAVKTYLSTFGRAFRIGVYGPRNVCKRVSDAGIAVASFVSDMSTGYSGNLGQTMPTNWFFDQVQTLTVGTSPNAIEIDKNIVSSRASGVSVLAAETNLGNDPLVPSAKMDAFAESCYQHCLTWADEPPQRIIMASNRAALKARIANHDALITALASSHKVYKALILTPMIWEGSVINPADPVADTAVRAYYAWKEGRAPQPPALKDDSSTGACQIFARTAISARNWARSKSLLLDRAYDATKWQDLWEIWQKLASDEAFNITTALYVMMQEATNRTSLAHTELRKLTPSQVMNTLTGYNGADVYGRDRSFLYYHVQRAHQGFRV